MNLLQLFDKDYLFDPTPGSAFLYNIPLIGLFLLLVMGSFYIEKWIRKHPLRTVLEQSLPHIGNRYRVFGIVGFILLWIRYENLPYLSMRFLLLFYLLAIAVSIGLNIYHFKTDLPAGIDRHIVEVKKRSYLPRKRKR